MQGADATPAQAEFRAKQRICRHRLRKPVVQPACRRPGMSRNTACTSLEPVIGLAAGETPWRDMTAAVGGATMNETPLSDASIGASESFWGRLAQYFR
jgi:hypothetical protein